jgi:hypothetical protein
MYDVSPLLVGEIKKGENQGYKNTTLETTMNTKVDDITDKTVKKITHHVHSDDFITSE